MYSRGRDNVNSDCLSRLPLPITVNESEPYEIVSTLSALDNEYISCSTIKEHTDRDPDLITLKNFIRNGFPDKIPNPSLSKFKSLIPNLSIVQGCIMYQQNRVFIPHTLRKSVIELFHENHPGVVGMKALARSLIWYPGMDSYINGLVLSCNVCQLNRAKPANANTAWPEPSKVWSRIHVDHFFYDNHVCLLVVDSLSRYIEVEVVKSTSVSETIDALCCIFARNGLPDTLVSDNATCFTAFEFQQFLSRNGIEHLTPSPGTPQANGRAERSVKIIKDLFKKCTFDGSLKYKLSKVLLQYRTVPQSVAQMAPSMSLNKRKLITLKDRMNPLYCQSKLSSRQK